MTKSTLTLLALCICCVHNALASGETIACKDANGQNVDWLYAYKLPKHFPPLNGDESRRGLEFVYLTPGSTDWQLSDRTVDDPLSPIGRIVSQAYRPNNTLNPSHLVAAYNDEPPGKHTDFTCGHTKGLLVADNETAIWLVHSVPLYPNISDDPTEYSYPSTGHLYAQSFLCISTTTKQVDAIGVQLLQMEPHFYTLQVPPYLADLGALNQTNRRPGSGSPDQSDKSLAPISSSSGNSVFMSFAKGRHFGADLYADFLAPSLEVNLLVETWRHGTGLLPSNCTGRQSVWNVNALHFDVLRFGFATTGDHAKWAVAAEESAQFEGTHRPRATDDEGTDWICVGDMNRAQSQEQRGGGTVCQLNRQVAKLYRKLVSGFEQCEKAGANRL